MPTVFPPLADQRFIDEAEQFLDSSDPAWHQLTPPTASIVLRLAVALDRYKATASAWDRCLAELALAAEVGGFTDSLHNNLYPGLLRDIAKHKYAVECLREEYFCAWIRRP